MHARDPTYICNQIVVTTQRFGILIVWLECIFFVALAIGKREWRG